MNSLFRDDYLEPRFPHQRTHTDNDTTLSSGARQLLLHQDVEREGKVSVRPVTI